MFEVGLALQAVSQFASEEMAFQVMPEISRLLRHSKGYVRKRAILALFRIVKVSPQILPDVMDRLKELLVMDPDTSVSGAVLCLFHQILVSTNVPVSNLLILAPTLFKLLQSKLESSDTSSSIKILALVSIKGRVRAHPD